MVEKKKVLLPVAAAAGVGLLVWLLAKAKEPPGPPGEVYVCPYCGAIFLTAEELAAHIYWHHPEEPPIEPEPEPPPEVELPIEISNLVVPEEDLGIDEPFYISFDIYNPNITQVVASVTIGGHWSKTINAVIDARTIITKNVSFRTPTEPGIYTITVDGLQGQITVVELKPLIFSELRASPAEVEIYHEVEITVKVANPNWANAVIYVVRLEGAIIDEKEVTIYPHQTKRVIFTEVVTWTGPRTVYCEDLSLIIKGYKVIYYDKEPPEEVWPEEEREKEREIHKTYRYFLDELVGGEGYLGKEWWALSMKEKAALQEEAERLAREWWLETYGETYPY